MAKLIVSRKQCQIIEETDFNFIQLLDKELSFFVQGAEHSRAYKGYVDKSGKTVAWDGMKYLLSPDLKFAPGLFNRVLSFYKNANKKLEIIDTRPKEITHPIDITKNLELLGKVPYYYQLEAVEAAKNNERGIIRVATGGGKSIIAGLITAALGKSTIIYVIGKDLLYQIHKLFTDIFDCEIGIIGDGKCEITDINIATVWTIGQALGLKVSKAEDEEEEKKPPPEKYKQIKILLGKTKVHIFDECHLAACDTIQGICDVINAENLYGLSASPWRDDGADLLIENHLGDRIIDLGAKKLIQEGYLVPPMIKFLSVPKWTKGKKAYKTIYKEYIIENENRNNMVATGAEKLVNQGFQTLVLFHNIRHGDILYEKISEKIPCALLSGKDNNKNREKTKNDLENGKINCVIASKIFDIGVDLPSLSALITAGGGKSSVRALQRIGRVIRKHPHKTYAAVLEFADRAPYLIDHSLKRKEIYETEEFNIKWPEKKS